MFGITQYPTTSVIALLEKTNFALNSNAILNIVGPPSSKLSIAVLDSNDNLKKSDSVATNSIGKTKYIIDLDGFSSGVYRAVVSVQNAQDSAKFSIGLETGSGAITLATTQEIYSPGESILLIGNTGNNSRITVDLFDPSGNLFVQTEIFSDASGRFSTEDIGIPSNGVLGTWKITAHSRLDSKSIDIIVSVPTDRSITLQIEETEFSIGYIVMIKGVAVSDSTQLEVEIINESEQVVIALGALRSSDNTFSLPWTVPNDFDAGTYTITVTDNVNSDSFEILVL